MATRYTQPTRFSGVYKTGSWAGYVFKEVLGYTSGRHTGVDYNWGAYDADVGQAVWAIADGKVVYVGDKSNIGFGKTIIIRHTLTAKQKSQSGGKTYAWSRYMHLQSTDPIKLNQVVKVGQKIATLGKTGTKFGHLHLDLWTDKNGLGSHLEYHKDTALDSYLDPYLWIQAHLTEEPAPTTTTTTKTTSTTTLPAAPTATTASSTSSTSSTSSSTTTVPEVQPAPQPPEPQPPQEEVGFLAQLWALIKDLFNWRK